MARRIAIAGGSLLMAELMAQSLSREVGFEVVSVVSRYDNLVEAVEQANVHVALIDPDKIDGDWATATGEIRRRRSDCGVALTVDTPTRPFVSRALKAGVLSVVPKNAGLRRLIDSVRGVASGQLVIDPRLLSAASGQCGPLTDREAEVLRLTAQGLRSRTWQGSSICPLARSAIWPQRRSKSSRPATATTLCASRVNGIGSERMTCS